MKLHYCPICHTVYFKKIVKEQITKNSNNKVTYIYPEKCTRKECLTVVEYSHTGASNILKEVEDE